KMLTVMRPMTGGNCKFNKPVRSQSANTRRYVAPTLARTRFHQVAGPLDVISRLTPSTILVSVVVLYHGRHSSIRMAPAMRMTPTIHTQRKMRRMKSGLDTRQVHSTHPSTNHREPHDRRSVSESCSSECSYASSNQTGATRDPLLIGGGAGRWDPEVACLPLTLPGSAP